jgi:hypothetical protein
MASISASSLRLRTEAFITPPEAALKREGWATGLGVGVAKFSSFNTADSSPRIT